MSKIVQLTRHDGKRLGLPVMCAIMIAELNDAARAHLNCPEAKTTLVADLGTGQRIGINLRDGFTQLLNLFPVSRTGLGWQHAKDPTDRPFVFPQGSIIAFEEQDGGFFVVTLEVAGGPPITAQIKATYEELEQLMGDAVAPEGEAQAT